MPKSARVDEPELLKDYLETHRSNSDEFRALVIRLVSELGDVSVVSRITTVPMAIMYQWFDSWNKKITALISRQGHGGGATARLSLEQKQELYQYLDTAQTHWTTQLVRTDICVRYHVSYSRRQVQRLLRQQGLYCGKP